MADVIRKERALIGSPPNHWLYDLSDTTFDLTRPAPPEFPLPSPKSSIRLHTSTKSVICSPSKTALIIIDMQNFFLSVHLGRAADGVGNQAATKLLRSGIPAAHKAGIQVIWLNWGLTDTDISKMPPAIRRAFGFEASLEQNGGLDARPVLDAHGINQRTVEQVQKKRGEALDNQTESGEPKRLYRGMGSDIGPVVVEDGETVDGGRLLVRDTWNASLTPALNEAYEEGRRLKERPDVWIHKNRMSGLWGEATPCTKFLSEQGISTLLFAGVHTDQCVGGSLQDAFSKGWDCILLKDACGTTSPAFATDSIEFNCAKTWGFVTHCDALEYGVQAMLDAN